jgi:hypothetical protein
MKKILFLLMTVQGINAMAQNIGIGTTEPRNKLHMVGGFLVNAPTLKTAQAPTPAQTRTMINASSIVVAGPDSTARIYDPGGPAGNYVSNLNADVVIDDFLSGGIGFEVTLESVQLGTGDSLIFREYNTGTRLVAVGNNYNLPDKWVFNISKMQITFKSNSDASNGAGFSILVNRLYSQTALLVPVSGFVGNSLFFDVATGSLRSGNISNSPLGPASVALGNNNTASGLASVALGNGTTASGTSSFAVGNSATASGSNSFAQGSSDATNNYAVAMGFTAVASGISSVAIGNTPDATGHSALALGHSATASGDQSIAIGRNVTAGGNNSIAIGNYVSTNGWDGSLSIGDMSTTTVMNSPSANNFRARFANGYRFYTSADYSTSCSLGAGDNAWATTSDVRLKENFIPVDGEGILKKIALMPLTTWNYKNQDPSKFRHYGPMAQDFHAAFGKDLYGTIGSDTTINQADFAGVSFVAIQALEKRTVQQQAQIESLLKEIEELKAGRSGKKGKANRRKKPST